MRIISSFRDYYDGAAANFYDDNIYHRDHKFVGEVDDVGLRMNHFSGNKIYSCNIGVVGFCGKLYPFYKIKIEGTSFFEPTKIVTLYTAEEVIEFYKKSEYNYHNFESNVHNFFSSAVNNEDLKKIFDEYKTAMFSYYGRNSSKRYLSINPILRTISSGMAFKYNTNGDMFYDFQKVKDSFQASQELDMYVCNVMVSSNEPPVEVSDETKAVKYGHDGKYSFKTPPKKEEDGHTKKGSSRPNKKKIAV